jgi:enoyl-CoA hydratase/carnithine racemase
MAKVIYEKRGKIANVTLNRPEAMKSDKERVGKHKTEL